MTRCLYLAKAGQAMLVHALRQARFYSTALGRYTLCMAFAALPQIESSRLRDNVFQEDSVSGAHVRYPYLASAKQGFTVIELLVYILLVGMFSTIVIKAMLDYWSGAATLVNDNETLVSREDAGDTLRTYLNVAARLVDQNSLQDNHVMVADPTDSTGKYWLTIHAIPGNTAMPSSGNYTPVFYFEAPSVDSSKNFIMNGAQPYYDEFLLYLNGTTGQLRLRKLINPSATGDRYTTSCPPASATGSCPEDLNISDNISSVDLAYYSKSGNTIDFTSSTDANGNYNGPDFPVVEVVSITLHYSIRATIKGTTPTTNQTVIRVALRN